ncbi:MAG: PLP-dependent aminotransferase family protein [SAR202 cluster bacterium]|nr:PLP-dependent aminotransferase family protein [SAR202 cluster bacterium]
MKESIIKSKLSISALNIGAGTPTDAGMSYRGETTHPNPIQIAGGIPDFPTLPISDFTQMLKQASLEETEGSYNYGGWFGYDGLREQIAKRQTVLDRKKLTLDNFIIHNGSSGALENVCKTLLDPKDVVIVEQPSYSGTVRAIRGFNCDVVEVKMNEDGIDIADLKSTISNLKNKGKNIKFIYTIPDFHNPTGILTSEKVKAELCNIASSEDIFIVEDATYSELYFHEKQPTPLFSLDNSNKVIKLGTFSKIISTGIRVGWVQAHESIIQACSQTRFDMGNSPLIHRALSLYLSNNLLNDHVNEMRQIYRQKMEYFTENLINNCEPYVQFQKPSGGFFLWVSIKGVTNKELRKAASDDGVMFPSGSLFYIDRDENKWTSHVRMAFSKSTLEELKEATERLQKTFQRIVD